MDGIISRATVSKQPLEMIYLDSKGNMSQRQVRVVKVNGNQVLAYCYARKQVRSFKLSNILSVFPYQKKGANVNHG
ncbi:hypothetical protein [Halobacillus salinus]|uniref:WYL domain-containing protein n=1 Tax=Halobacillus salinus TaxID=192814 RepID=A0A4Z0H6E5_9BACI|nr:hypothetical protein [Halobacillus salinus]TGB04675.1 hypothetical protein E4663_06700 [Halobacillus salinus]